MFGVTLVICIGFLSLGSAGEPEDDCFLPNPNQYYLLTTTAEGNYQNCREHRSSHGYRSAGIPPNSASRAPKGNKNPKGKRSTEECEFEKPIHCDDGAKYRTYDGSCNNLKYPYWGKAETPLARFLKSDYHDGKGSPRLYGKHRKRLPNPRDIRLQIHEKSLPIHELEGHSHFLMLWGQRTSHDMIEKVEARSSTGGRLDCCGEDIGKDNCEIPILLRVDDPYFSQFNRLCLNFRRSKASPDLKCNFETRQQLSEFTGFVDASDLYGSNDATNENIRTKVDGLLKTTLHSDGNEMMPQANGGFCRSQSEKKCFQAGDRRVNQQPALMSVHTILLREHNRIARELKSKNPHWNDEMLFQESRKIVIGEIQHITYNSYLPKILGSNIMNLFDLKPRSLGKYFTKYDDKVIPTIRNGFMAAAFRFGHSMVNNHLAFKDHYGNNERTLFRHLWVNPDKLYETDGIEKTLRGLQEEHSQSVDRYKTEEITDRFFESPDRPGFGNDLISININRGRDHGIVGYLAWRKMCKLPSADNFYSLTDHSRKMVRLLQSVYRRAADIDLFVGGVTETPLPGALVGPTFACILGLQFKALKYGDRFYYENDDSNARFTIGQLNEIKKATLARIICRNSNIGEIQQDVFSHGDQLVNCYSIQDDINFSLWEEIPQK
ncbi:heme peroxidase 2-like [Crassostrea angulata]|uniref:heme peroxidase 2-like n=1 Tax=Magallana angulata TaxID=2784310 RepID=UPI0022B165CE|nr:heme peroxidase 2-like [Crassostrea angulata]